MRKAKTAAAAPAVSPELLSKILAVLAAQGAVPAQATAAKATVDWQPDAKKALATGSFGEVQYSSKAKKPYAVLNFDFGGRSQKVCVWL